MSKNGHIEELLQGVQARIEQLARTTMLQAKQIHVLAAECETLRKTCKQQDEQLNALGRKLSLTEMYLDQNPEATRHLEQIREEVRNASKLVTECITLFEKEVK